MKAPKISDLSLSPLRHAFFLMLLIATVGASAAESDVESANSNGTIAADKVSDIEKGRALAFNRNLGNCLACHFIVGGELPGNIAPPLIQMKLRFPDKAVLRTQIWDASTRNSETVMPPYGRHGILTEQELDLVVDFVHQL